MCVRSISGLQMRIIRIRLEEQEKSDMRDDYDLRRKKVEELDYCLFATTAQISCSPFVQKLAVVVVVSLHF